MNIIKVLETSKIKGSIEKMLTLIANKYLSAQAKNFSALMQF